MTSLHRAVAYVAAAFVILGIPPARAHEEAAVQALAVITEITPPVQGLDVRVVQLTAPVLVVTNNGTEPVTILGEAGEPFLRITPRAVETNGLSPTSYRAVDPTGERPLPRGLDPTAAPEWIVLAHEPSWSWFDPRAVYSPEGTPGWSIPILVGDRRVAIHGSYEPIEGHGHFVTRIVERIEIEGLVLRLFDGLVPAIFVRNDTDRVLAVPGRSGEPFLRIGPRGVFGNLRSPDFYAAGSQTVRDVPVSADPRAEPRWERLSDQPVWQWLEYRARLPAGAQQRAGLGSERKTVLSWTTPLTLGDDPYELTGEVEWLPPRGLHPEDGPALWLLVVPITAVLAALAFYLLRTQRASRIG
ncbi:MAG: hypothetical protein M3277_07440 [Actinomycetota bacterium]|nr:hypothetical protein [Actinomycetota bacterium]